MNGILALIYACTIFFTFLMFAGIVVLFVAKDEKIVKGFFWTTWSISFALTIINIPLQLWNAMQTCAPSIHLPALTWAAILFAINCFALFIAKQAVCK